MSGGLEKRSMRIGMRRTSVALEKEFWVELERIAKSQGLSMPRLFARLLERADGRSLASTARVFALTSPPLPQTVFSR